MPGVAPERCDGWMDGLPNLIWPYGEARASMGTAVQSCSEARFLARNFRTEVQGV